MNYTTFLRDSPEALLWPSLRASSESAWHGHVSFMHWLINVCSPEIFVELGTHNGVSFAAACNAAKRGRSNTKLFAVDTWQGDEHAGLYGNTIYDDINTFIENNFGESSVLMRCLFKDALPKFRNKEIDILHIDGLHTYEAVSGDFEAWLPKMSDRGVVLFHDITVLDRGFGVWKLWEEVSARYPAFSFAHSYGLGVLMVGDDAPSHLLKMASAEFWEADRIRSLFAAASTDAQEKGLKAELTLNTSASAFDEVNICIDKRFSISSELPGCTPQHRFLGTIKDGSYSFHTELEHSPWVCIDLDKPHEITEIKVFNRLDLDCGTRASSMKIALSENGFDWRLVHECNGRAFGGIYGKPLRVELNLASARFVRLWLADQNYFHLDQVEIYGRKRL